MIKRPTSLELMERFYAVEADISSLNDKLEDIKGQMETKLAILNTAYQYGLEKLQHYENKEPVSGAAVVFSADPDKIVGGNYDCYGETVHASYISMPIQVFNILTETGPIYKDNAKVEFYATDDASLGYSDTIDYKCQYSDILKHEADLSKSDVFKVFKTDRITMAVEMTTGTRIGNNEFDTIELNPYLPGSFDITEIRIYNSKKEIMVPDSFISEPISSAGNMRFSLGEVQKLYRIEFDIKLNYQCNGYPFGLKHLYFYKTSADTSSDSLIIKIDNDRYIDSIGDRIELLTPWGVEDSSICQYGIRLYMFYDNNTLTGEIEPENNIARNIKSFFAEIPLREPLIGLKFKHLKFR